MATTAKTDSGLTPRQARFVEEYLIDLNASRAAEMSGLAVISTGAPGGFYVYGLVSPVTDAVFYVGKGIRGRWMTHYREEMGSPGNHAKRAAIMAAGRIPRCVVFAADLGEAEAYGAETALIRTLPGLSNVAAGQKTDDERQEDAARCVLAEMATMDEFQARRPRSPEDIVRYQRVIDELHAVVAGLRPTKVCFRKVGDGPWLRKFGDAGEWESNWRKAA